MTDRRRELKRSYKELKTEAGVYQIRNTVNGKTLVVATPNIKTMEGKRFQLRMGSHKNPLLQADWKQYGEDAFVFEVLEVLDDEVEGQFAAEKALEDLDRKWTEKLDAYGERGYGKKD